MTFSFISAVAAASVAHTQCVTHSKTHRSAIYANNYYKNISYSLQASLTNQVAVSAKMSENSEKRQYLYNLVKVATEIVKSIWTTPSTGLPKPFESLEKFIELILFKSNISHNVTQLALLYLVLVKDEIQSLSDLKGESEPQDNDYTFSGCHMFLAALICARKFLQDKTFKNGAWCKLSGLDVKEINAAERKFLQLRKYELFVSEELFKHWTRLVQARANSLPKEKSMLHDPSSSSASSSTAVNDNMPSTIDDCTSPNYPNADSITSGTGFKSIMTIENTTDKRKHSDDKPKDKPSKTPRKGKGRA